MAGTSRQQCRSCTSLHLSRHPDRSGRLARRGTAGGGARCRRAPHGFPRASRRGPADGVVASGDAAALGTANPGGVCIRGPASGCSTCVTRFSAPWRAARFAAIALRRALGHMPSRELLTRSTRSAFSTGISAAATMSGSSRQASGSSSSSSIMGTGSPRNSHALSVTLLPGPKAPHATPLPTRDTTEPTRAGSSEPASRASSPPREMPTTWGAGHQRPAAAGASRTQFRRSPRRCPSSLAACPDSSSGPGQGNHAVRGEQCRSGHAPEAPPDPARMTTPGR